MHCTTTTFATLVAAVCTLAACDASVLETPAPGAATATPASYKEDVSRIALKAGPAVESFEEDVVLSIPEGRTILSPEEAMVLGQAITYAGADIVVPVFPFPNGWPPPVCEPPPGSVSGGCPFEFDFSPDLWKVLFDGELPFAEQEPEADFAFTFGFWHRPAEQGEVERLVLKNGITVMSAEKRVFIEIPEGEQAPLSGAEALLVGQAISYAALDLLAPVFPVPTGWPPPVCDPPSPKAAGGGCPFTIGAGPELWKAAFGERGLPLAHQDPRADWSFSYGFWQRLER